MIRDPERMARSLHDVVVVGGGIYGACVAREAVLRGLSVALVERGDFGGATSSQSLKIVHGGLRYLQHLDLVRMRQSILERRLLMRIAPHLVHPLPCLVPTWGHGARGREALAVALRINDLVGFDRNSHVPEGHRLPAGRTLGRGELLRMLPGIAMDGVSGGAIWFDAQTWSTERLLLGLLESASRAGADVANGLEAERLLVRGRRVEGVAVRDLSAGTRLEVRARVVVNAAGPWVDQVLSTLEGSPLKRRFLPSRAVNLVVRQILPEYAVGIPGAGSFRDADAVIRRGTRLLFLVPWRGHTLVGTRHFPARDGLTGSRPTRQEVETLLAEVNAAYPPARLGIGDVVAVLHGVLPEKAGVVSGEVQLEKHPRIVDHAGEDGVDGLVTVVGVKWTTARRVGADVARVLLRKLGRRPRAGQSENVPVAGGSIENLEQFLEAEMRRRPASVSRESMEHILRSHGADSSHVLAHVLRDQALGRPLRDGSPVIGAQVVHAALGEMALHLEDVVLRRTELWVGPPLESRHLEICARLMAGALGWDSERVRSEVERAEQALARLRPEA